MARTTTMTRRVARTTTRQVRPGQGRRPRDGDNKGKDNKRKGNDHNDDDDYKVEADGVENSKKEDHIKDDDYRTHPESRKTRTERGRARVVDNKDEVSHLRGDKES